MLVMFDKPLKPHHSIIYLRFFAVIHSGIHMTVYIIYTMLGDVCVYVVGKDEYDELPLAEVIFVIASSVKDACGKPPTKRLFLDKYGKICLCLDEIIWMGMLENSDKD